MSQALNLLEPSERWSKHLRSEYSPCIVLSRKVDCDVCERVAKLKKTLKLAVPPSSLNTLQKERTRTV